ncbi:unnamed protein product [Heligmosomoides polygyrus]|uniref:Estradiol 17-beta-dehydrogenase 2 n=1 Tax=Heligmosomoides polygyrus TaxID=6339 RepID=A0A3P8D5N7_HELPZ|nr:unnamed protein product [Heligmosomoides polygyrus]
MDVFTLLAGLCALFLLFLAVRWILERFEIPNLEKKAVLITGCDSGFGRALATRCAERGMPVFAGCILPESIAEYRKLSKNYAIPIDAFLMDVSSDRSVTEAKLYLEGRTEKYGADYKEVAEVNVWGVIRVTQAMKPLVKKTRGRIVTVTSICSRLGLMGIGPYTAAKFAASGYCDVIRCELQLFGVSVHVVEPGFFNTHLTSSANVEKQLDTMYANCPEEARLEYGHDFFVESHQNVNEMTCHVDILLNVNEMPKRENRPHQQLLLLLQLLIFDRNQREPINATQILTEQDILFQTTYDTKQKSPNTEPEFGKNSDGKVGIPNLLD